MILIHLQIPGLRLNGVRQQLKNLSKLDGDGERIPFQFEDSKLCEYKILFTFSQIYLSNCTSHHNMTCYDKSSSIIGNWN